MTDRLSDALMYDTVSLDWRKVAAHTRIGAGVAATLNVSVVPDSVRDSLLVKLSACVLTQHLDSHTETASKTVTVTAPATWWQHFKCQVLDHHRPTRWFVRWRPVRMRVETRTVTLSVTWEQYASFPEASVVVDPSLGRHRLNVLRQPPGWTVTP